MSSETLARALALLDQIKQELNLASTQREAELTASSLKDRFGQLALDQAREREAQQLLEQARRSLYAMHIKYMSREKFFAD
jgi:hypothetical protein